MNNFQVRQGTALPITITLTDGQGDPITSYTGSESLTAKVWPGGNLAAAITPTVAWVSPSSGTISVLVSASQTAGLSEGRYLGAVNLLDPVAGWLEACPWSMDVLLAPGTATTGLLYCTFADMLDLAATWPRSLQNEDSTEGFVKQVDKASRWLDDLILARYPTNNYAILGDPGYGSLAYGNNPGALPNQWLRTLLASGGLVIRPKVVEAVASRALALIAKGQIGVGESKADYRTIGRIFESESSAIAMTLVAEICTDGTGVPTFGISLGSTSLRPMFGA